VIDYTKEDFTKGVQRYEVILDNVGTQPLLRMRRALFPNGRYIMIGGGGTADQGLLGPLARPLKAMVLSPFMSQKMEMMMADPTQKDMIQLADLMQAGKVTPVIDRRYKLSQVSEAIRYLEEGHARGKVVIDVP
jgi:NADPH:quinone reductase-like Zn-dependent oxidoreductase